MRPAGAGDQGPYGHRLRPERNRDAMNRVSTRGGGFGLSRFTSNGNQYTGAVPGLPLFFFNMQVAVFVRVLLG